MNSSESRFHRIFASVLPLIKLLIFNNLSFLQLSFQTFVPQHFRWSLSLFLPQGTENPCAFSSSASSSCNHDVVIFWMNNFNSLLWNRTELWSNFAGSLWNKTKPWDNLALNSWYLLNSWKTFELVLCMQPLHSGVCFHFHIF